MKFANASRIHKGTTGPKGEEGIKDELFRMLGRDPDPDELEFEMRRKKGYNGVSESRRKHRRSKPCPSAVNDYSEGEEELLRKSESAQKWPRAGISKDDGMYDESYVRSMQKELEELHAKMSGMEGSGVADRMGDVDPSSSVPVVEMTVAGIVLQDGLEDVSVPI